MELHNFCISSSYCITWRWLFINMNYDSHLQLHWLNWAITLVYCVYRMSLPCSICCIHWILLCITSLSTAPRSQTPRSPQHQDHRTKITAPRSQHQDHRSTKITAPRSPQHQDHHTKITTAPRSQHQDHHTKITTAPRSLHQDHSTKITTEATMFLYTNCISIFLRILKGDDII